MIQGLKLAGIGSGSVMLGLTLLAALGNITPEAVAVQAVAVKAWREFLRRSVSTEYAMPEHAQGLHRKPVSKHLP